MGKPGILALVLSAATVFGGARVIEQRSAPILDQLGITAEQGQQAVWRSFADGYFAFPRASVLKSLGVTDRAKAARDLCAYAKDVTRSPEFLKSYQELRDQKKPKPPDPYKSMADQKKEMKESLTKSVADMEKNISKMPPDQKEAVKYMKEAVVQVKQQIKELDDPNNPMFNADMEQMNRQMYDTSVEQHKAKIVEWEAEWPQKPDKLVARRLQEFIDLSKSVDFAAKLVDGEKGIKKFANPAYESKSSQWKMCFRAGKEATDAARGYAEQWLKELK